MPRNRKSTAREIGRHIGRPQYIVFVVSGVGAVVAGTIYFGGIAPWESLFVTVGGILITLGISLPIAIFYQTKQNVRHFDLLNASQDAGIRYITPSRNANGDEFLTRVSHVASSECNAIRILAIGVPELFDPKHLIASEFGTKIYDSSIPLAVLLLDPKSPAAQRRHDIEEGRQVLRDIQTTISERLPSIVRRRLENRLAWDEKFKALVDDPKITANKTSIKRKILPYANIDVRVYKEDPAAAIIGFSDTLFVEQYHFGRPEGLVDGACIGGYVPVIAYSREAPAFTFFEAHFEYVLKTSHNITDQVVADAADRMWKCTRPTLSATA